MDYKEGSLSKLVIHVITKGDVGGAQTSLLNYVEALSADFHQQVFIGGANGFLAGQLDKMKISNFRFDFKSIKSIAQLYHRLLPIANDTPPIIMTHSFIASSIVRFLLIGSGVKIIYVIHGFIGNPSIRLLRRIIGICIEKFLNRCVDKYIVITNYEKTLVQKYLKREAIVIPNTTKLPKPMRRPEKKVKKIVCLSRFSQPKLNLLIVKSFFSSVLFNDPKYELLFFGLGPDLEKCKEITKHIDTNIQYHEPVSEISQVVASASSVILMSKHEGLPMTILEALANDTPIICSSIPELTELFKDTSQVNIRFCNNDKRSLTNVFNDYEEWISSIENGKNRKYFINTFETKHINQLITDAVKN